jgi:hypothetical protein
MLRHENGDGNWPMYFMLAQHPEEPRIDRKLTIAPFRNFPEGADP